MNTLYHLSIVKTAFRDHLSPAAIDTVARYNFNTDFYGVIGWKALNWKVFPLYPFARRWYQELDHFDHWQEPEKIIENWRMHRDLIMEIADDKKHPPGKLESMYRILGRSSHAISDLTSHTNFVPMLFEYYSEDEEAKAKLLESGMTAAEYIPENAPTFGHVLNLPAYARFREKYLPKLFAFISVPDEGPRSHSECGMDSPNEPRTYGNLHPGIFKSVYRISERDVSNIVRELFDKLKIENPAKFQALAEDRRDILIGPDGGPRERRARFWAQKVGGWD
ncbi:MAG TPA: hypothetical protein PLK80_10150 [bacterium]|nr:MAG: hypothetical protein BWY28_00066 [bacterium ADurb.Bin236]HOY64591.1 hypothetical protein [bacterium]HPI77086.1 hypothetical protein [bacterium]HPN95675.1 hypothetical protein [bacterium]